MNALSKIGIAKSVNWILKLGMIPTKCLTSFNWFSWPSSVDLNLSSSNLLDSQHPCPCASP